MKRQLNLDTRIRASLAQRILASLERAASGSTAELRGSLAGGDADDYSDIDILWQVPDEFFPTAIGRITETLAAAHPLQSLRSDRRRLFFAQFQGMPLFWRADIDVLAQSLQGDPAYDQDNPAARGDDWSRAHSALMNAVGAVKAILRGQEETAKGSLRRGFARVGLAVPAGEAQELVPALAEGVAALDPAQAALAQRIVALHREVFGPDGSMRMRGLVAPGQQGRILPQGQEGGACARATPGIVHGRIWAESWNLREGCRSDPIGPGDLSGLNPPLSLTAARSLGVAATGRRARAGGRGCARRG